MSQNKLFISAEAAFVKLLYCINGSVAKTLAPGLGSFCDNKDHEGLWSLELFCGWNIEEFGILREKNFSMWEAELNSGRNY